MELGLLACATGKAPGFLVPLIYGVMIIWGIAIVVAAVGLISVTALGIVGLTRFVRFLRSRRRENRLSRQILVQPRGC